MKLFNKKSIEKKITITLLYYEEPEYLLLQIKTLKKYKDLFNIVIIDDGSKKFPIENYLKLIPEYFSVLKILDDIPWNIPGARNLSVAFCQTKWSLQLDIDHIIPEKSANKISELELDNKRFYSFNRKFSNYTKPTAGTLLFDNKSFWKVGGYNEDFTGNYGQNDPYLKWKFFEFGIKEKICKDIWIDDHSSLASCELSRDSANINIAKFQDIQESKDFFPESYLRFRWKVLR